MLISQRLWQSFKNKVGADLLGLLTFSHPAIFSVPVQNDNRVPRTEPLELSVDTTADLEQFSQSPKASCIRTKHDFPTHSLFCCCCRGCYCLFPFAPFYSLFLSPILDSDRSSLLCITSPSDLHERLAHVILPDHHCMTCFYISLTKELFDQGVWCVIVRNSACWW